MATIDYKLTFNRLIETKLNDGTTRWISSGTTFPKITVESIEVGTSADYSEQNYGAEPFIIPMGVKECKLTLVGKFEVHLPYLQGESPGSEITNRALLDTCFDDGGDLKGIGVQYVPKSGNVFYPELLGKWAIDMFTWDRQAKELGSYKFTMTLAYVWEDAAEAKIFQSDIEYKPPQNVSFLVNNYKVINPSIKRTLFDINTATFIDLHNKFEKDDVIQVYCSADGKSKIVFEGYVKSKTLNKDNTITYECNELGGLLWETHMVIKSGGFFQQRVFIRNPLTGFGDLTIGKVVSTILGFYKGHPRISYNPGTGFCTNNSIVDSEEVPGQATKLPSQMISGMSIGKALQNFVENNCGMYTWFNVTTHRFEYGFIRDSITIKPSKEFIINTQKLPDTKSFEYVPDVVVVWNADASDKRMYAPDATATDKVTLMNFRLNTNNLPGQLETYAKRIYDDAHLSLPSYRVIFPPGTTRFKEGDYFTGLGDQTIKEKMNYLHGTVDSNVLERVDDSLWQIKEVIITDKSTDIIIGSSYHSVFDIFKTAFSKQDAVPAVTEQYDETTGTITTQKQGATTHSINV